MNNYDKDLIIEFKYNLPNEIKIHLRQLIVFGSRARGEALPDSDLDVVALVDEKTDAIETKGANVTVFEIQIGI